MFNCKHLKSSCIRYLISNNENIISEKGSCNKTSASLSYQNDLLYCHQTKDRSRVKYTKYVIGNIRGNASGSVLNLENEASNISGILKCGRTILLPVGILYNKVRCVFNINTLDATQLILLCS
jgi:hypothetical protein